MLAKAERDLSSLESAVQAQDDQQISDALYNFAVAISSVRDWLEKHPSKSFSAQQVKDVANSSAALNAFRDIANGTKHRVITKYKPTTAEVAASATAQVSMANWLPYRMKIGLTDGSRHEAVAMGHQAVKEWKAFFVAHGVA